MNRRGFLAVCLLVSAAAGAAQAQTRPPPATPGLIELNGASRDELMTLDGIGEVRADAIIRSRPFRAKTELVERRIIPEALYEKINDKLTVRAPPPGPPTPQRPAPAPVPNQPRRG
jgi:competence protein ComEA